jgi:hypothetical protein
MKPITKYQAADGSEWKTESECLAHESLCDRVAVVMKPWPARPKDDGCSFANGHGYIQLSEKLVAQVRNQLLDLIGERIKHDWVEQSRDMAKHPSWVARLLSDYGIRPLEDAWWRLSCVDKYWREWGQPYYAANPEKGEQRQIA